MFIAHAFSNVKNTVESTLETLTAVIRKVAATLTAPITTLETSMFSIAISTVSKDTDFSQNDMDNAFEIFMEKSLGSRDICSYHRCKCLHLFPLQAT